MKVCALNHAFKFPLIFHIQYIPNSHLIRFQFIYENIPNSQCCVLCENIAEWMECFTTDVHNSWYLYYTGIIPLSDPTLDVAQIGYLVPLIFPCFHILSSFFPTLLQTSILRVHISRIFSYCIICTVSVYFGPFSACSCWFYTFHNCINCCISFYQPFNVSQTHSSNRCVMRTQIRLSIRISLWTACLLLSIHQL